MLTIKLKYGPTQKPIAKCTSLEGCQRAYIAAREESGLGASEFGDGIVTDANGEAVARISYNGRAWPMKEWSYGDQPIAEAPAA